MLKALDEKNEPMVAFLCNRPSMYRTEQGWVKDDNTGCLRDPVDILNYCRKVCIYSVVHDM
jgi:Amyloid A4 N-terminal heparin-binding